MVLGRRVGTGSADAVGCLAVGPQHQALGARVARWRAAKDATSGMLARSVATPPTTRATRGLVCVAHVAQERGADGRAAEEGDGVEGHDPAAHGRVATAAAGWRCWWR